MLLPFCISGQGLYMKQVIPDHGVPAAPPANPFREIPPVADLCITARTKGARLSDASLTDVIRREVERVRDDLRRGVPVTRQQVEQRAVAAALAFEQPRLGPVLNATGVVIHTNLGRAPVSAETATAMAAAARSAVPLEIDPETNTRGGRMFEITAMLHVLTGAEAALVVNNNAAAVLLVLTALAHGREVVVSRGEAIEIGGGFRIPDVLRQSGARLVEVGTTNRTYVRDYAEATAGDTAAYLKVHPSNFRISGFVQSPRTDELATLARERNVPLLEDVGSGALLDTAQFGLAPEPTLREVLGAGVDLAMASGDKLLGGPQAGIIVGRADLMQVVASHPLARAVRADKATLAGTAATLRHYLRGEGTQHIPVWRMISAGADDIKSRAERIAQFLSGESIASVLVSTRATVGGGSLPGETLPSWALALDATSQGGVEALARRLRLGDLARTVPGVFSRVEDGRVLLDLRTVLPEDDAALGAAVAAAYQ